MLEFALRAIRSIPRTLRKLPVGVLLYTDEGRDARYSAGTIQAAASRAKQLIVLRPGNPRGRIISHRRGQRKYRFRVEGEPLRPGAGKKTETLRWVWSRLEAFAKLTRQKERTSISAVDVKTERLPLRLPHRVTATMLMTYPEAKVADTLEREMRAALGRRGPAWELELISDRPPMRERRAGQRLIKTLEDVAGDWEIPLSRESSAFPSVAGLAPARIGCVCGVGPVARDLGTPHEAVRRISLVQRTLLMALWLARQIEPAR
jgi:D-alanine-D-alanine ligase